MTPRARSKFGDLVGVRLHAKCPVALKRFLAFSKSGNVQETYLSPF